MKRGQKGYVTFCNKKYIHENKCRNSKQFYFFGNGGMKKGAWLGRRMGSRNTKWTEWTTKVEETCGTHLDLYTCLKWFFWI